MYDILILCASKDFDKFKYVYKSLQNLSGYDKIYCISDHPINKKIDGVNYLQDKDVIDFDFSRFTGNILLNKGWYIQQFIKLFQQVTSDSYLVIDSDTCIVRKIDIIENDKPAFLIGTDLYNEPYFNLMEKVFNLEKVYNSSFINEIMYFKREIINEMLSFYRIDKYGFFDLVVEELNRANKTSGFSEYEFYGNYVTKYFPDAYNYKKIVSSSKSKMSEWDEHEINKYIEGCNDCDTCSFHTYLNIRD